MCPISKEISKVFIIVCCSSLFIYQAESRDRNDFYNSDQVNNYGAYWLIDAYNSEAQRQNENDSLMRNDEQDVNSAAMENNIRRQSENDDKLELKKKVSGSIDNSSFVNTIEPPVSGDNNLIFHYTGSFHEPVSELTKPYAYISPIVDEKKNNHWFQGKIKNQWVNVEYDINGTITRITEHVFSVVYMDGAVQYEVSLTNVFANIEGVLWLEKSEYKIFGIDHTLIRQTNLKCNYKNGALESLNVINSVTFTGYSNVYCSDFAYVNGEPKYLSYFIIRRHNDGSTERFGNSVFVIEKINGKYSAKSNNVPLPENALGIVNNFDGTDSDYYNCDIYNTIKSKMSEATAGGSSAKSSKSYYPSKYQSSEYNLWYSNRSSGHSKSRQNILLVGDNTFLKNNENTGLPAIPKYPEPQYSAYDITNNPFDDTGYISINRLYMDMSAGESDIETIDWINSIDSKTEKTELEAALVDIAKEVMTERDNLDRETIDKVNELVKDLADPENMKKILKDGNMEAVTKLLSDIAGATDNTYSGYLSVTGDTYITLQKLLNVDIAKEFAERFGEINFKVSAEKQRQMVIDDIILGMSKDPPSKLGRTGRRALHDYMRLILPHKRDYIETLNRQIDRLITGVRSLLTKGEPASVEKTDTTWKGVITLDKGENSYAGVK